MTRNDYSLMRQPEGEGTRAYPVARSSSFVAPSEESGGSVFRTIRRALDGRWHWAILLAVLGLAGGGVLGWVLPDTVYRSEGRIYIDPYVPTIADPMGQSALPRFENFLEAQVMLLRDDQVVHAAMETEAWRGLGRSMKAEEVEDFKENLGIARPKNSQNILVWFVDKDPRAAQIAVNGVIDAYGEAAREFNSQKASETLQEVERKRLQVSSELNDLRAALIDKVSEYGGIEGLSARLSQWLDRVNDLEFKVQELKDRLKLLGNERAPETPRKLTAKEILERGDAEMRSLLASRAAAEEKLRILQEERGYGPNSAPVKQAKSGLDLIDSQIEDYRQYYNQMRLAKQDEATDSDRIKQELMIQQASLASAQEKAKQLGAVKTDYLREEANREAREQEFQTYKSAAEKLREDIARKGKIIVLNKGKLPTEPYRDASIKGAIKGGFAGGFLGFGLILLLGLLDHRLKSSGDATGRLPEVRLLGLVPTLPENDAPKGEVDLAAHCVHQIRTMLEIRAQEEKRFSYCLTGPTPGTGKSTLTMALGLSFAAAGSKTLIVDFDFTGRGLTRQIGRLLAGRLSDFRGSLGLDAGPHDEFHGGPRGLIRNLWLARGGDRVRPSEELEEIVKYLMTTPATGLPEMNGTMDSAALLARVLREEGPREAQRLEWVRYIRSLQVELGQRTELRRDDGDFLGILEGSEFASAVAPTGIESLWHVPLGRVTGDQSGKIAFTKVARFLELAKSEFEVVLVDTGPVPGSLEAHMVASLTDATVLVVSRGEERNLAVRAVRELHTLGASFAGFVFNRADMQDALVQSRSRSMSLKDQDHVIA